MACIVEVCWYYIIVTKLRSKKSSETDNPVQTAAMFHNSILTDLSPTHKHKKYNDGTNVQFRVI